MVWSVRQLIANSKFLFFEKNGQLRVTTTTYMSPKREYLSKIFSQDFYDQRKTFWDNDLNWRQSSSRTEVAITS